VIVTRAYKESISIDDSNHASWFSSIKFITISNKIAQSLDLKNNKIINAILNKFFINEWNKKILSCQGIPLYLPVSLANL
jgi:hypothetical protein